MKKKSFNYFILIYALYYSALGSLGPYWMEYFKSRGFSYGEISFIFSIMPISGIVIPPIWGYITDKYLGKIKTLMIVLFMVSIMVLSFVFVKSFIPFVICLIVFLIFQNPIIALLDANSLEVINKKKNIDYSKIRLMGSVGYALASLTVGYLAKIFGINYIFVLYSVLCVSCLIIFYIFKEKGEESNTSFKKGKVDVFVIFKNKSLLIFIISYMFFNISNTANGNYIAELIRATGGDVSALGLLSFFACVFEIITFFFIGKIIKKKGILKIYRTALIMFASKYILDSFATSYVQIILLQGLKGVAFAAIVTCNIQYINNTVKSESITSALTISGAICAGIGGFIGNMISGKVLSNLNVFILFRIMSIGFIIAIIISFLLNQDFKKEKSFY